METELNPCPFCGSSNVMPVARRHQWYWHHKILCNDCDSCGEESQSKYEEQSIEEASQSWNKRSLPWIDVDEQMPEEDESVLVWASYLAICYRDDGVWKDSSDSTTFMDHISHWMPAPKLDQGS